MDATPASNPTRNRRRICHRAGLVEPDVPEDFATVRFVDGSRNIQKQARIRHCFTPHFIL